MILGKEEHPIKLYIIGKFWRLFRISSEFYPVRMTRRLNNWSYRDVKDFLTEKGFTFLKELGGSHEAWIKRGNEKQPEKRVEVNFTHGSYPVKTLKTMIRQSGIDQSEWIKWAGS